jgi:hypothetical protein
MWMVLAWFLFFYQMFKEIIVTLLYNQLMIKCAKSKHTVLELLLLCCVFRGCCHTFNTMHCRMENIFDALRVLKRLGFTHPFVRRASYFGTNLSEDCYAPSWVLQDWKQERYFHSDFLDYHSEGIWNQVHFDVNYSHLSASKTLIFNVRFISTFITDESKV